MKSLKRLLLLALAVALAAAFASCAAKPATYTVTYELNGGVNHPDNPATYTSESGAITLKDPSRNGYTFNGWSPDGGVIPAGSTGDKVFTANWTGNAANPLTYTITYVLDGGVNHPDNPATYTSESGAISLKDPSRDGYTFDGWTPDGGVIPTGSTGAKTFTANWTENSSQSGTNTITYDFQDGTGARETRTVTAGAPYTLIDGPVYAPYTFGGWYPEIGGGGTEKKSGTSYNAGNITLYAYWKGTDRVSYENVPDVVGEAQVKGLSQPVTLSPGTLVIQPYYNGKPVTRIGNSAFIASSEIQKITDVLFPDSMRIIGSRAFESCQGLTRIDLPANVVTVSQYAFQTCRNLETVTLPDGLATIESSAFNGCAALRTINIPAGIEKIQSNTFWGCESLAAIELPDGLTEIGGFAFTECVALTEITVPENVTSIGSSVFWKCAKLVKVIMENSTPPDMGNGVFSDASARLSLFVPTKEAVSAYKNKRYENPNSYMSNIETYPIGYLQGDYVIDENQALLQHVGAEPIITIPETILTIKANAFKGYSTLKELTIANGVTVAENNALSGCVGIEKITLSPSALPSNLVYLFATSGNPSLPTSLKTIVITGGGVIKDSMFSNYHGNSSVVSIVFAEDSTITSIGADAFYKFEGLEEIVIPLGVTTIDENAFSGCSRLTIYAMAGSKPVGWDESFAAGRSVYYYSAEEPATEGNYWRYVDGAPVKWNAE